MIPYLAIAFIVAVTVIYLATWLIRDERPRLPWEINWDRFGKFLGWLVIFAVMVMLFAILLNLATV